MDSDHNLESELQAMTQLGQILSALEVSARRRVLAWAADAFSVQVEKVAQRDRVPELGMPQLEGSSLPATFAELLELTDPSNNADRALVAAGWIQEKEDQASFDGRSINRLLKEHGVDVSNVTNALTALIERRPRLAIQAGKKGKFEKLYRLTTEGRKAVRSMMRSEKDG
jgi:hypothetical protein